MSRKNPEGTGRLGEGGLGSHFIVEGNGVGSLRHKESVSTYRTRRIVRYLMKSATCVFFSDGTDCTCIGFEVFAIKLLLVVLVYTYTEPQTLRL